jgi:hypothetical protein
LLGCSSVESKDEVEGRKDFESRGLPDILSDKAGTFVTSEILGSELTRAENVEAGADLVQIRL